MSSDSKKKNIARDLARTKALFDAALGAKAAYDQQCALCDEIFARIQSVTHKRNELNTQLQSETSNGAKTVIQMEIYQLVIVLNKLHASLVNNKKRRVVLQTDYFTRQTAYSQVEASVNSTMATATAQLSQFEANLAAETAAEASLNTEFSAMALMSSPPAALKWKQADGDDDNGEDEDNIEDLLALTAPIVAAKPAAAPAAAAAAADFYDEEDLLASSPTPTTPKTSSGKKKIIIRKQ